MIKNCLESAIFDYDLNFLTNWERVMSEYKRHLGSDKMWLAGPSSYLFSLSDVKFAVDIQIRRQKDIELVADSLIRDFTDVSFILITHQHGDHFCVPLAKILKDLPIKWYLPQNFRRDYLEKSGLTDDKIVYIKPGDVIKENNIVINTFFVPHAVGEQPFLQCGYEIKAPSGKILITGDIRDYDYNDYPKFENVDLCISHLWAGRDSVDEKLYIPMLEKFSETISSFDAKKYFLCHLYEIGRGENSMWSYKHTGLAMDMIYSLKPQAIVEAPKVFYGYNLFE